MSDRHILHKQSMARIASAVRFDKIARWLASIFPLTGDRPISGSKLPTSSFYPGEPSDLLNKW